MSIETLFCALLTISGHKIPAHVFLREFWREVSFQKFVHFLFTILFFLLHAHIIKLLCILFQQSHFGLCVDQINTRLGIWRKHNINLNILTHMNRIFQKIAKFAPSLRLIKTKIGIPETYKRNWIVCLRKPFLNKIDEPIPILAMHNLSNTVSDCSVSRYCINVMDGHITFFISLAKLKLV